MTPDPMFPDKVALVRNGYFPRSNDSLPIFRMNRVCPTVALIVLMRLPRKRTPAWLLTLYFSTRIVGPEDITDGSGCGTQALFAFL